MPFILVVPVEWTEINHPEQIMSYDSWERANPWEMTEALKTDGQMQEGYAVTDSSVFQDSGTLRVWVLIKPE